MGENGIGDSAIKAASGIHPYAADDSSIVIFPFCFQASRICQQLKANEATIRL